MRPSAANEARARNTLIIPRGWVIVGAAAAGWLVLLTVWLIANALFSFVGSGF